MHSHGEDLRAEVESEGRDASFVDVLLGDWTEAELPAREQALAEFAAELTRRPGSLEEEHLEALRRAGLTDPALHRAAQVVGYFNYINRVADAVHVDLEPEMPPDPRRKSSQG
jgi:uncharacterized peroxidase-related enzyme